MSGRLRNASFLPSGSKVAAKRQFCKTFTREFQPAKLTCSFVFANIDRNAKIVWLLRSKSITPQQLSCLFFYTYKSAGHGQRTRTKVNQRFVLDRQIKQKNEQLISWHGKCEQIFRILNCFSVLKILTWQRVSPLSGSRVFSLTVPGFLHFLRPASLRTVCRFR